MRNSLFKKSRYINDHKYSVDRIKDKIIDKKYLKSKSKSKSRQNESLNPKTSGNLNNYSVDDMEFNCDPNLNQEEAPKPKRFWGCVGSCK